MGMHPASVSAKCCGNCARGRTTAYAHHAIVCDYGYTNKLGDDVMFGAGITLDTDICPRARHFKPRKEMS